jgi:hypothetical protein
MGEFVDEDDPWPPRQNGIQIHFGENPAPVVYLPARVDLEPLQERLGFLAPMGLHDADDDIDALPPFRLSGGQHFIGFADARGGAQKYFEAAGLLLASFQQKLVRGRSPIASLALVHQPCHWGTPFSVQEKGAKSFFA